LRRGVTSIRGTVALFPIISILIDAPIADPRHSLLRHTPTSSDDLSPPSVPHKTTGALASQFDTKGPRGVALVPLTIHGDVVVLVKAVVDPTVVKWRSLVIVTGTLITTNGTCSP